jgi:hypothetical protein
MKYRILTATTEDLLAEEVEKYLSDGWALYGDPFTHSLRGHFCQAVTYTHSYSIGFLEGSPV